VRKLASVITAVLLGVLPAFGQTTPTKCEASGEQYNFESDQGYYIEGLNIQRIKRARERPIRHSFCRDCRLAAMFSHAHPLSVELRRGQ
jgi:hypothetical protein